MTITLDDPIRDITLGTERAVAEKPLSDLEERTNEVAMVEILQLALEREAIGSQNLKGRISQVQTQVKAIDLLLDFSKELTALPDNVEMHDLNDKMKEILQKLETDHGITICKEDSKISKEKLSEFKAQIGAQVDKLRTEIQTTVSTEIQPETQNLQNIMNVVQKILDNLSRLLRKTLEIPR